MRENGALAFAPDFLDLRVQDLMDRLAAGGPGPRSGSAAALVAGIAAALVAMSARLARDWDDAAGVAAQAETLRIRLGHQADVDARVYQAARDAFAEAREGGSDDVSLGRALEEAAEIPLAIAETACDVAQAAALVADRGDPDARPDAAAAAALAAGAARAAAHLVAINLGATQDDERVNRADAAAHAASEAAAAALASA
jgi:formiminotetrahydrofolate cyclodeaminase